MSLNRKLLAPFWRPDIIPKRVGGKSHWLTATDYLSPGDRVLSAGAGNDISFELSLIRDYQLHVTLLDPSPTGKQTGEAAAAETPELTFEAVGLAGESGQLTFAEPFDGESNQATTSGNRKLVHLDVTTLDSILERHQIKRSSLLKLDIEGMEYPVLQQLCARPAMIFDQILVEVHHHLPGKHLWQMRLKTLGLLLGLRQKGYRLFAKASGNLSFLHDLATRHRNGDA